MDRSAARAWTPDELDGVLGGWSAGPGPLYRRLADALGAAARTGDLAPDDRLPAERPLAAALGISRATVAEAYDALRGAGTVVSRRGSGTRIAALPGAALRPADGRVPGGTGTGLVQRLVDGPADVISLSVAAEGAAPEVRQALTALLADGLDPLLAEPGYHPCGLPELRAALADRYTAAGLRTAPEQLLVTTGATQALALVAQLHVRRGSPVVVETPSWPGCLDALIAAGARPRRVPLDADGMRLPELRAALAGAALAHVTPTYHNPTGILMSAGRRTRIGELCTRAGVPVVEDLAYDTRLWDTPEPGPLALFAPAGAQVLSVGSLAKSVWGGLRIGWLRGPAAAVERLARLKTLADLGSPLLDQALAVRLLPGVDAVREARAGVLRERLARLESLLRRELPDWSWERPAGGGALWVRLPGGADAAVFARVALRRGVELVPGAATDPSGAHDAYVRLPFTLPPARLDTLTSRLATAWSEFT
ncbi:PLP-dependent aminotransferase family protein [Streptomyces sp. NBC_00249]|uniref:aminotransferase-like domain-containing protein n=1 Tax=Streptomyces sp. NBC_00249 TaxID=2975690 RepID=UPI0022500094|nr:PLP-dependent aminotransferase family protein [Streptomyces sp. NBC_00249]MCX5193372.1 PLP-dependent aminotransferase family protein [Streptomyces sp. NBC_00249]